MYKRVFLIVGMVAIVSGCATTKSVKSENEYKKYTSVQALIEEKSLNQENDSAKEYIYDWGPHAGNKSPQSTFPKQQLGAYCQAKSGTFSQLYKSQFSLLKDTWSKRLLNTYGSVTQGIGAYRCEQKDGQQWIVSIEPVAERKLSDDKDIRVVSLHTRVLSESEAKKIYAEKTTKNNNLSTATSTAKNPPIPANKTVVPKPAEVKKEEKTVEVAKEIPKETVQQQQQRLYLAARRDFNRGVNRLTSCSQAEQAYNLGRFYNASGPNIQAESGVLVAKCLTTVVSYQKRFNNPQERAKGILQQIVKTQNHPIAKHMLQQLD